MGQQNEWLHCAGLIDFVAKATAHGLGDIGVKATAG